VSKNVAVFVDVANIFYAAKAAGVDIDYVTLLKAATAGRDFVRAYAYTGLDPENENQRQFHAFLARSGYKVISKDIRKYGDGRIKANLDIELVVDMMKTARNLDIAVVVSGDGDFAPAIRAVQEQGVRVEVISFRGNTSSDLIDVADQFTDIAQIARVERSSVRSGRRVAAEGDLSMTEVPEKETEGAPRRRRGGGRDRVERPERAEPAAAVAGGNLIVLPGERLSRADGEAEVEDDLEAAEAGSVRDAGNGDLGEIGEDGRRRRRRRGGRGRGRGRRPEDEAAAAVGETVAAAPAEYEEEEEAFEELPPAVAPVHAFGSVWDSQIGVASASLPPTVDLGGGGNADDEDYDEPEVPEYLLAERRQRGQRPAGGGRGRPGGGGGRNRSAYQAALDRERYGRGAPQPSFGGGGGVGSGNSRPDRGGGRNRQGRPQQGGGGGRPIDRSPRMPDRAPVEQRSSSEPWTEVPPELEEMLRAELARRQPAAEVTAVEVAPSAAPMEAMAEAQATKAQMTTEEAKPKRAIRSRAKKPAEADAEGLPQPEAAEASATADATAEPVADEAKPKRATRPRAKKAAESDATAPEPAQAPAEEAKKPTRRRKAASAAAEES
jgi:uncharacterized LabA/DUF88 family protein